LTDVNIYLVCIHHLSILDNTYSFSCKK